MANRLGDSLDDEKKVQRVTGRTAAAHHGGTALGSNQPWLLNRIEVHPIAIAPFAFGLFDVLGTATSQIANHKFFTGCTCDANGKNHTRRAQIR